MTYLLPPICNPSLCTFLTSAESLYDPTTSFISVGPTYSLCQQSTIIMKEGSELPPRPILRDHHLRLRTTYLEIRRGGPDASALSIEYSSFVDVACADEGTVDICWQVESVGRPALECETLTLPRHFKIISLSPKSEYFPRQGMF